MRSNATTLRWFLPVLFLITWVFALEAGPKSQDSKSPQIYQIYPSTKKITIKTKPGYGYRHVEGDLPDWRLGKLKEIRRSAPVVTGNGAAQVFQAVSQASYHLVEESLIVGKAIFQLQGGISTGYHYFIRQGDTLITEGEVKDRDVNSPDPISLSPGQYTFQAVALGSGTPRPISFTVGEKSRAVKVAFELTPNRVMLFVNTKPSGIAKGKTANLRRIDPIKQTDLWNQKIEVDSDPIALQEGHYVLEYPKVQGYASQGDQGVSTRFELTSYDHSKTVTGDYLKMQGQLLVGYQCDMAVTEH